MKEFRLASSNEAVYHKLSEADALKLWRAEQTAYVEALKQQLATLESGANADAIATEIAWREKQTDDDGRRAIAFLRQFDGKLERLRSEKN